MKKKYAHIYHEIDNQSDSEASYCNNCEEYLGSYPTKIPIECPKCKLELKEIGNIRVIS